jgi:hypothetical protein
MKNRGVLLVWLAACWAVATAGQAQVTVDIQLEQTQFLPDESLPIKVRIVNRSGRDLPLGKEADWLTFVVQTHEGRPVAKLSDPPVQEEFTLESSMAASRKVDLMPSFDLSQLGRYTVTALVKIKAWNQEIASPGRSFEVTSGFKLWEQSFGVPGTGEPPEVRKYALLQANYLKKLMLYVRLTDATETKMARVFPAGPLMSFSRPEPQIDRESNLHLLFQKGARAFGYLMINPAGEMLLRQTHDIADGSRPSLRLGENGRVYVAGGSRRLTREDVPLPPPEIVDPASLTDSLSSINSTSAGVTNALPAATTNAAKSRP